MALDMTNFYSVLMDGTDGSTAPFPLTQEKSAAIQQIVNDLDDPEQASACVRALVIRYHDESLIIFCIQRLLDSRPKAMGPQYKFWRREVYHLSLSMRGSIWGQIFRQKLKVSYPKVAMNMWPQQNLSASI